MFGLPIGGDRRSFLTGVAAFTGLAFISPERLHAGGNTTARKRRESAEWDLSWLDDLKGKHRQLFDVGEINGERSPLHITQNYLNAHRDVYGLAFPDINTVVGIAGRGFPINASDPLWVKYSLGEQWRVKDPKTGVWATHNIFLGDDPKSIEYHDSVRALQARGSIFWQCNNALNTVAHRLADATKTPFEAVRDDLIRGLNPGVKLIPAHTMLVGLAQEHGCTYEAL